MFPQFQPWNYYAPRFREDPPRPVALDELRRIADRKSLREHERAILMRTDLPRICPIQRIMDADFEEEWSEEFGFGVWVVGYRRRR